MLMWSQVDGGCWCFFSGGEPRTESMFHITHSRRCWTVEPPSLLCRPELFHSMSFVHSRRATTVIALTLQPGAYTDNSCLTWIPCTHTPGCQSMSVHCFYYTSPGVFVCFPKRKQCRCEHHIFLFSSCHWIQFDDRRQQQPLAHRSDLLLSNCRSDIRSKTDRFHALINMIFLICLLLRLFFPPPSSIGRQKSRSFSVSVSDVSVTPHASCFYFASPLPPRAWPLPLF